MARTKESEIQDDSENQAKRALHRSDLRANSLARHDYSTYARLCDEDGIFPEFPEEYYQGSALLARILKPQNIANSGSIDGVVNDSIRSTQPRNLPKHSVVKEYVPGCVMPSMKMEERHDIFLQYARGYLGKPEPEEPALKALEAVELRRALAELLPEKFYVANNTWNKRPGVNISNLDAGHLRSQLFLCYHEINKTGEDKNK